jgi:hypothetical protein
MPAAAAGTAAHILRGRRNFIFPELSIRRLGGRGILPCVLPFASQAKLFHEAHIISPFC